MVKRWFGMTSRGGLVEGLTVDNLKCLQKKKETKDTMMVEHIVKDGESSTDEINLKY